MAGFSLVRKSVSALSGNSSTESRPASAMVAPVAELNMPNFIPIAVAATMKGSEAACTESSS